MIDRAASRRWIEKFAGLAENRISLAAKYPLSLPTGSESVLCRLNIEMEMFCQPFDVARRNLYSIVNRATISRTLVTIVVASLCFGSCHPWFVGYRLLDF
jgi:hypothetical protein